MKMLPQKIALIAACLLILPVAHAVGEALMVPVQVAPGKQWTNYPTRTLAALPASATDRLDSGFDPYGGLLAHKEPATGFFYPKMIGDRWWLIDPDGGRFIHKAVVAVSQNGG